MSSRSWTIRPARADDTPLLPDIERAAAMLFLPWAERCGLPPDLQVSVNPVEDFERARKSGMLWVAALPEGTPVGFALVMALGGYAHLDELDVLPEHGQCGAGSALLRVVCDWAHEAGYPGVTLSTFRHVPWNAPFYERRGFRVIDPHTLSEDHVRVVEGERRRGLRTDLRVIMVRP